MAAYGEIQAVLIIVYHGLASKLFDQFTLSFN